MVQDKVNEWYGYRIVECSYSQFLDDHIRCIHARATVGDKMIVIMCVNCKVCIMYERR